MTPEHVSAVAAALAQPIDMAVGPVVLATAVAQRIVVAIGFTRPYDGLTARLTLWYTNMTRTGPGFAVEPVANSLTREVLDNLRGPASSLLLEAEVLNALNTLLTVTLAAMVPK